MTNLIKADFNGTQVLFQSDAYLNATSIAKRFNKQPRDYLKSSRTKEYINALIKLQNSTKTKILVKENQLVTVKNGGNERGTWLHPKLAIDFARWLSAEFAVWCDEQIEKILYPNVGQNQDRLSSSDDRVGLRQAVSKLVSTKGLLYPDAYNIVNNRMGTEHIDEMTVAQAEKATDFVYYLMANDIIEGELLPKTEKDNTGHINGLALLKFGAKVLAVQNDKLDKAAYHLSKASTALEEARQCRGAIYDGFHESIVRLNVTGEEHQQSTEQAEDIFENWKKRKHFMA